MACYLIGCELTAPGESYIDLTEAIRNVGSSAWQCMSANWLIVSDRTAAEIRDELKPYLHRNDALFVAALGGDTAWRVSSGHVSEGLKQALGAQHAK